MKCSFMFIREQIRASKSSSVDHAEHTPELQAEISRLQVNHTIAAANVVIQIF